MKPTVLVRADSSSQIGTGHIMRCLVFADMLREGGFDVRFLSRALPGHINGKVEREGFPVLPVMSIRKESETSEISDVLLREGASIIVFDHYGIDADQEELIRSGSGVRVVSLDDTYNRHYSDILINPNIYAKKERYAGLVPDGCTVLCGLAYALVRKEFRNGCGKSVYKVPLDEIKLLVTLGGADPDNVTARVIKELSDFDECKVTANIVLGPANSHVDAVRRCAGEVAYGVNIIVDAQNMAELMCNSDCIVTSSGGTFVEALFSRVPAIVVNIASNQNISYTYARQNSIAYTLDKSALNKSMRHALHAIAGQTEEHLRMLGNLQKELEVGHGADLVGLIRDMDHEVRL